MSFARRRHHRTLWRCSFAARQRTSVQSVRRATGHRRPEPTMYRRRRLHRHRHPTVRRPVAPSRVSAPGPPTADRRRSGVVLRRPPEKALTIQLIRWMGLRRGRLSGGQDATSGHRAEKKRRPRRSPSSLVRIARCHKGRSWISSVFWNLAPSPQIQQFRGIAGSAFWLELRARLVSIP